MRAADLHKMLARETGAPLSEIDQRTRWLHQASIIRPGRGRNAPQLDQLAAAYMIMSMVARRAVDAEKVARRLARELVAVPRSGVPAELQHDWEGKGPLSFEWALFGMILDRVGRVKQFDIAGLEMSEDGGTAWVLFNSGRRLLFTDNKSAIRAIKKDPERYDRHRQAGIDRRLYIGSEFLADLAFRLEDWLRDHLKAKREVE